MKIAIICDVLGEANNGTTLAAMNLISHLKKKGHDVRVVSPDKNTQGKDGYFVVPTLNLGKYLNGVVAKNGVSLAKVDEDVLRTALDGVDVVHLLTPFTLSKAALRLAKERGIPVSASFHCQAENITSTPVKAIRLIKSHTSLITPVAIRSPETPLKLSLTQSPLKYA